MRNDHRYVLGESENEHSRLRDQSVVLDPLTRSLLIDAGITEGMRVLDIGTGSGAVAALAADLVGSHGHVLAIDRDPTALDGARAVLARHPQVEVAEADLAGLDLDGEFDAIIGRAVLMHLSEPVETLVSLAQHLRPNGLLVMHEFDLVHEWTNVNTPLWERVRSLVLTGLDAAGVHIRMGSELFAAFRSAGLPDPHLTMGAPAGGGDQAPSFGWANSLTALLPYLEQQGMVSDGEFTADSLTQLLDDEIDAANATLLGPLLFGAHCTVP